MGKASGRKGALEQDQSLLAGIQKNLVGQKLTIGKESYSAKDVIKVIQQRVTTNLAVDTAKVAWTAALKADKDERATTKSFVQAVRTIVLGMFGELPDTLAEFGLSPRKSTKVTVAVKADAIAKGQATRVARGTKGKKQKAQITGAVAAQPSSGSAVAVAPATAPKPTS